MDSDSESFTKDEQLNIQMELRESKESGYDAFNDDTFGSAWVGASKDWTLEENVLANERLAGSEFLSQSEAGKTQRKAKAGKENATPRPHSQKFTDGCRNCGHHHQSAAKFCIICGAKLEVKAPVVVTPRILAPSAVYTADSRHNIGTCGHRAPTAVYTADSGHNIATYAVSPSPAPVTAPPGNLLDKQPAEPPFQSWAPQAVQAPTIAEGFNFATKDPLKVCVLESIKTSVMAKPLHPEFPAKKMVPSYVQHPATTVLQNLCTPSFLLKKWCHHTCNTLPPRYYKTYRLSVNLTQLNQDIIHQSWTGIINHAFSSDCPECLNSGANSVVNHRMPGRLFCILLPARWQDMHRGFNLACFVVRPAFVLILFRNMIE